MYEPINGQSRVVPGATWLEKLAAGAAKYRKAILTPRLPTLEIYAFGKHPAWRDFIDPSLLPTTPRIFQHFHVRLRAVAEAEYALQGGRPVLAAWRDGDASAVLLMLPSRDRADPTTGSSRPALLFLGACARGNLGELFQFSAPRLTSLAAYLQQEGRTAEQFLAEIQTSRAKWTDDFRAAGNDKTRSAPESTPQFRSALKLVGSYETTSPDGCFLLLPESSLGLGFATGVGPDSMNSVDFRAALVQVLQ